MDIVITKGTTADRIAVTRADGTGALFDLPHKGPVPHDAVHYFVERALGCHNGFWGMVAAGSDPQAIGGMARAAGHASASRAAVPDPAFAEIIQVERLVEAFEADLWGGGGDNDAVRAMAAAGCAQSHVPPLAPDDALIGEVRGAIDRFRDDWSSLAPGSSVSLRWPEAAA